MNRKRKRRFPLRKCLLLFFLILGVISSVNQTPTIFAQQHEPWLHWRMLTTPHFTINYPEPYDSLALAIGKICEDVYPRVSEALHYYPGRTHVVVHTRSDLSNGTTTLLPWRMELYITETPENWIGSKDSWLRILITHEFTHVVHLRKVKGLTAITYPLLGEFNSFWQGLTPHWFIEGLPTVFETRFTNGGRGRNPYHQMLWNATTIGTRPWPFNNINYISRKRLPVGMYYVAGYYLVDWIRNQAGEEAWTRIMDQYTKFPVFGFDFAVKKITGKTTGKWYEDLLRRSESLRDGDFKLRASWKIWGDSGTVHSYIPTNYFTPRWLDNGTILSFKTGFDVLPGIVKINSDNRERVLVTRQLSHQENGFSVAGNQVVWSEFQQHIRFDATVLTDLYRLDRSSGKIVRLTYGARVFSPDVSPDGGKIAAVHTDPPGTKLVLIDRNGNLETVDSEWPVVLNPRWSPDGRFIAAAVKDANGWQDIAIYDLNIRQWRLIYPSDLYHDNTPCWSPDGKTIYFASDRSGIFNIWSCSLASGMVRQVTDARLGAFSPDISPDGKHLACAVYTPQGFRIVSFALRSQTASGSQEQHKVKGSLPKVRPEAKRIPFAYKVADYSPLGQILRPQAWMPVIYWAEGNIAPGFVALSQDVLHRHSWFGTLGYSPRVKKIFGNISYTYSRFWPEFGVNAYELPEEVTYQEYSGWWRKQGLQFSLSLPLVLETNVFHTALVSAITWKREYLKRSMGPIVPLKPDYRGVQVGVRFRRSAITLRDVVPYQLQEFWIQGEWARPFLGGDYRAQQLWLFGQVIIPTLIRHHQLQFQVAYQGRRGQYPYSYLRALPFGYDDDGRRQQMHCGIGYHFPIWYVEWRAPLIAFYVDFLRGGLLLDWGTSWNHGTGSRVWAKNGIASAGIQLGIAFSLGIPMRGSLAYVYRSKFGDWVWKVNLNLPSLPL